MVETRDGADELSGAGVTTWTERMIPAVTAHLGHRRLAGCTGRAARCVDGVALASGIEWDAVARPAAVVTAHAPAVPAGELPAEATAADEPVPAAAPAADEAPAGFDELWGETIVRAPAEPSSTVADAPEEPLTEVTSRSSATTTARTISLAEARAMRDASGDPLPAHDSTPTPLAPPRRRRPGGSASRPARSWRSTARS